jgi:hypothetical protein
MPAASASVRIKVAFAHSRDKLGLFCGINAEFGFEFDFGSKDFSGILER